MSMMLVPTKVSKKKVVEGAEEKPEQPEIIEQPQE
jgi:hypothetical protein